MKEVTLEFLISKPVKNVYDVVSDFANYQAYAKAVNSVVVTEVCSESCQSAWEVKFRDGILKWIEKDYFFPETNRIEFHQVKGDLEVFSGYWEAVKVYDEATHLTFNAHFDLGLPQLEKLLDPIAQQALEENITSIVQGLFGELVTIKKQESTESDAETKPILSMK